MTISRFLVRTRSALPTMLVGLALATVSYAQPAQSPIDPTVTPSDDANPSQAQKDAALDYMVGWIESNIGPQLGMENPRQEWTAKMVAKDTSNLWHFTLNQVYKGIPVKGGHLNLALQEGASSPAGWHGQYVDDINLDTNPKISKQRAIQVVQAMVRQQAQRQGGAKPGAGLVGSERPDPALRVAETGGGPSASLEVHPGELSEVQVGQVKGNPKLTYHVKVSNFSSAEPILMEAWVDNDGNIVEAYNNLQTTHPEDGRGYTFYQGPQGLGLGFGYFKVANWFIYGVYVLNDNYLRFGAFDMYGGSTAYQAAVSNCCGPYFGNGALSNRNSTNADAYWASVQTYSFMYYWLARNFVDGAVGPKYYQSVDGLGPLVTARNHVGVNYNNAYWDGVKINLGDGDGATFQSLTTLDIIGHEWTHGLTQYTGGLSYWGESGALNESFSDIFGAMTERYWYGLSSNTWKIGEGAWTPATPGDALRYMDRPTNDGYSRDYYPFRICTSCSSDNGGVHGNSGIMNNAFYLLVTGACHRFNGCMSGGIGDYAATQIFWRALHYYIIPTDGFSWARQTTLWAAADLYGYGSTSWLRTREAWDRVGVPRACVSSIFGICLAYGD